MVNSGFDARQASSNDLFRARGGEIVQNNLGPLQQWAREAPRTAQEVGEAFDRYAVRSLDSLNSGLADAIAKGGDLGDVLRSTFQDAEAAVIRYLLKQAEIGLIGGGAGPLGFLAALIPAHAAGTNSAPGGLSLVGERGPELVNLPRGAQVIPNATLAALSRMQVPAAGGVTVVQHLALDLRGAVMTQDILDQINAAERRATVNGAQGGHALARRDMSRAAFDQRVNG